MFLYDGHLYAGTMDNIENKKVKFHLKVPCISQLNKLEVTKQLCFYETRVHYKLY